MVIVVLDAESFCSRVDVPEIVLKLMRYLHNSFVILNKKYYPLLSHIKKHHNNNIDNVVCAVCLFAFHNKATGPIMLQLLK